MPRNENLRAFAKATITALGDFGVRYVTPLRAFLQMQDEVAAIKEVIERGLTQDSLKCQLDDLLANDEMLFKCCGNSDSLAFALDILFFGPIPDQHYYGHSTLLGCGLAPGALENELDELEHKIYDQGEFVKTAYFNMYNLSLQNGFAYPDSCWRLEQVSYESIKAILQGGYFTQFLESHAYRTFAVVSDSVGFNVENLSVWLTRRWGEAASLKRTLQLALDGTIDVDYVIPHFNPPWVNRIHGGGLFQMGTPRKEPPQEGLYTFLYSFDLEDIYTITRVVKQFSFSSAGDSSRLKKAIGIATEFFEESHRKISGIERFANLMIALEALYTPTDKSELAFRISQTCALLVTPSMSSEEPEELYKFLKSMYSRRSNLFHGQYDINSHGPDNFIDAEDLRKLYSTVRKSIIAFMCLFLRGERSLESVRQQLETALLNDQQRENLRQKAQIEGLHFDDLN